ncbi:MAG: TetR/AcrR family transcriptional regulator, partial [Gammaproteobacteria bacterium]
MEAIRRRAGRRVERQGPAVRRALLDCARRLFAEHGYAGVSLRQVGRAAGVNPAMVHYYFGDKRGLYRQIFHEAAGPVLDQVRRLIDDNGTTDTHPIQTFLTLLMRTLARSPWLPAFITRDVLAPDGEFREEFVHTYASPGGTGVATLITREIAAGRLRSDLDPDLAALSLVSLALYPFIALPVARRVFDVPIEPDRIQRLVEHTTRLFFSGTGVSP